ncbi:MAG: hypothetical protein EGR31_07560 [Clostridium sp.]|nr:hypothetical protein [Clostridium sp.]
MGFQAPPPEPIRLFLCPPSQKPVFDLAAGKKIPLNGTSGGGKVSKLYIWKLLLLTSTSITKIYFSVNQINAQIFIIKQTIFYCLSTTRLTNLSFFIKKSEKPFIF